MPDWLTNVLAVIGALWVVCAVGLGMFVAACWVACRTEERRSFDEWEREVSA